MEVVEEGIVRYVESKLVGPILDKPPFFNVKKASKKLWSQYGKIYVFSTDDGIFISRFNNEKTRDDCSRQRLCILLISH